MRIDARLNSSYGKILYYFANINSHFYKLLHKKHVDLVIDGSIKFSSARRYRILEEEHNDKWIGDAREGLDVYNLIDGVKEIHTGFGQKLIVRGFGNRVIKTADALIFSLSFGNIENILKSFHERNSDYDAAIRINSISRLYRDIWRYGTVNGKNIRDICRFYTTGFCSYATKSDLQIDWAKNGLKGFLGVDPKELPFPNLFQKDIRYSQQNEFRIILYPNSNWRYDDEVLVQIPRRDGLMRKISLS
ncbi:MAG: hypothetical protein KA533_02035 [Sphingobium sp.]|nr:hypothetical protein [Sphingobium sp.]MBP6112434.1 hypothetical protein [Sphingobium sp.]MBP8671127.1 hypothetical protein [Sphingobium sp.]MBP9157053.1 hypothetical protein [Sphingobium sp.]MCC6480826.1 hypothetical protein [Sphingomonadaceae bacterium]